MSRGKLVIWGGNGRPLDVECLDSHASVTAFFLMKHLARFFEVVNLVDVERPEALLEHTDAVGMLSTFQSGFTRKIVEKGKAPLIVDLRRRLRGPLCSIVDRNDPAPYCEDILFTVLPPTRLGVLLSRWRGANGRLRALRLGWSAEPSECRPTEVGGGEVRVFVDHPHYNEAAPDCTRLYFEAFTEFRRRHPAVALRVFHQGAGGVEEWELGGRPPERTFGRGQKVPWREMISWYRRCHVFCVTHAESAGLAAIEAAMCGARVYVPARRGGRTFVSRALLRNGVPHSVFPYGGDERAGTRRVLALFERDLAQGFTRERNHERLADTNSWERAAQRVRKALAVV